MAGIAVSNPGISALTALVNLGNVSGTTTLDLSAGSIFLCTVTGNTVFQFANWPSGAVGYQPYVIAQQDATGHTISFTGVSWLPSGSPPVFMTGASQINITAFLSVDNGTTIYGQGGSATGGGFGVYGDGSDGAVVLDGTATYSFLNKSGNFYTMTRDIYPSSLTLGAGVSLQVGTGISHRIICAGALSLASGSFITTVVGGQASGANGGYNGTGGSAGTNGTGGSLGLGSAGPNGGTGAGTIGVAVAGASGGFGGAGGASGATAGGGAGLATLPSGETLPRALPWASLMARFGNQTSGWQLWPGGASGGAGAGDGTNSGGGGGCGANALMIAALSIANAGTIQANGGTGGTAAAGNAGGGGGGQGGPVVLIYGSYSGAGLVRSLGGNGGAAHGTGVGGASGGAGWIIQLVN
jgi:hypothetical protein